MGFALSSANSPGLTLWNSLEYVGCSQIVRLNLPKGGADTRELIRGHRAKFKEMVSVAFHVARGVKHNGGLI